MKQPLIFPVLLLALLIGKPAFSADSKKGLDAYKKGDYATSLREWKSLAEKGDATAQSNLGFMYDNGQGVPQDYKTAIKWYKLAAKQGIANAQYKLGQIYYQGQGAPQDYKAAFKWYKLAAEQGVANAHYKLGQMYGFGRGVLKDNIFAYMWWDIAASQGDREAKKNRYIVEKKMSPTQFKSAQNLSSECVEKNYKEC